MTAPFVVIPSAPQGWKPAWDIAACLDAAHDAFTNAALAQDLAGWHRNMWRGQGLLQAAGIAGSTSIFAVGDLGAEQLYTTRFGELPAVTYGPEPVEDLTLFTHTERGAA